MTDDPRPEYDFSKLKVGVRGKYAERFHTDTNLIPPGARCCKGIY